MVRITKTCIILLCLCMFLLILSGDTYARRARTEKNALEQKEFRNDELYISQTNIPLQQIIDKLQNRIEWQSFITANKGGYIYIDPRSGRPSSITYVFPMIPGTGENNAITLATLEHSLGYQVTEINERVVEDIVTAFLRRHAALLAINLDEIEHMRNTSVTDFLWQVYIKRQVNGIPVRDANIVMTINHGNLVVWGLEKWGDVDINLVPSISKDNAINAGMSYIGGQLATDTFTATPHLEIIPVSSSGNGLLGEDYDHRLVWAFAFKRDGFVNNWELLVDAHTGQVISMRDLNLYATRKIVGATYAKTNDDCCPQGCPVFGAAMSYTNTGFASPNNYTSLSGQYEYTSGTATTTLNGDYVLVSDNCGSISESSATGDIDLGGLVNQHDCTIPSGHSAGDTFSSRTAAAEVAQINRMTRSWINNSWCDNTQMTSNMNINNTCNAYYSGNTINFYRSGGGCRNTGEEVASIDHEWAHGLDDNDANGNISNPGEVYADMMSIIKLHAFCPDPGWWWTANMGCGAWTCPTNPSSTAYYCDGYGDCCLTCTGLRSLDWADHVSGVPHTPANFNCVYCSGGLGPCGKEEHCENAPGAEAGWDLAARDLQAAPFNYSKQTAFMITTKLYIQGSGNVTTWHSCNCTSGTSDGCAASAGYMQWLAADDDNGNVNNGTPHMTAIYAAFNRHAIACATPTPQNTGCSTGPTQTPVLTVTTTSMSANLSWTAVPGASSYYVFKGTGTWACDMEKVRIATVTGTSYVDTTLDCHPTAYAVMAVGSTANCFSPMSACAEVTPPYPGPSNVTATPTGPGQVTVNWTAVPGATAYNVYRRYTVCGAETESQIATNVTGTTYVDNSALVGVTNYYGVTTISSCESSKSAWASCDPTGTCSLTPCFSGATSATNNQTSNCAITLTWDAGSSSCSSYPTLTYAVYRSTDPAFVPGPSNLLASCVPGTSYQDSTPNFGTTYYYVVRAEDSRTGGAGPCNGGNMDTNVVKVNAAASGPATVLFSDGFESGVGNWTISAQWQTSTTNSHNGTYSVWSNNLNNRNCDTITKTTAVAIPSGAVLPRLHFWTVHNIESGYDAGIVFGSPNGSTWTKLTVIPPYPGATNTSARACLGTNPQPAFSGSNMTWTEYQVDLTTYAGGNFQPRFTYATDGSVANGGWYIDDVTVDYGSTCTTSSPPGKVLNTLTVNKVSGNPVLNWTAPGGSCTVTAYGVYRGSLPFTAYNHTQLNCNVAGTTHTDSSATNSYYYLVVPNNAADEGSYGLDSAGSQIPQASSPCKTQNLTACN
ncbi:MAG: hypothetical protein A2Y62_19690 [Candidatus Fischerbacteria bacterium RBG_13_37_8]|uniref:Fibronectin type-III domain-containing protein n=1 Tax=Candidatus Fischerbacteria bacterium RBG_13_37_8 TaxID=1817863 RepID=A0A1F5VXC8_9BACT|nr:MAG: hypothetical protein A2Y62_19690 [Candidatus Fischerbacteria bacterium RBG_13_37_8]